MARAQSSRRPTGHRWSARRGKDTAADGVVAPEPAPGELELVQALVNTATPKAGTEELRNPGDLERWLSRRGLINAGRDLTDDDLRRVVAVREALRSLLLANNGGAHDAGAHDRLDGAASGARFQLRFDRDGAVRFEPVTEGLDAALGRLLEIVAAARLEGLWPRFKACANAECRRAYYDTSRSGVAKWCARRCGERVRARNSRRFRKHKARGH